MKGRFVALLISLVIHIGLFTVINTFYRFKKTIVEPNPNLPQLLKVALVLHAKKPPSTNNKVEASQPISSKTENKTPKNQHLPLLPPLPTKKSAQKMASFICHLTIQAARIQTVSDFQNL